MLSTAVLPKGWRRRLVLYESEGTEGVRALCLEPHDLWISKAIAGRPKDREFCSALLSARTVRATTLRRRLGTVPDIEAAVRDRVLTWIAG